jgi:Rhodopirellula transposase DDE domain
MNAAADAHPDLLRISRDAKATVKVGPFARGGKSRAPTTACDHDFKPDATLTPVGIFLPASDQLFIYHVTSKVTSDCLLDRLVQWWQAVRSRFSHITTLVSTWITVRKTIVGAPNFCGGWSSSRNSTG